MERLGRVLDRDGHDLLDRILCVRDDFCGAADFLPPPGDDGCRQVSSRYRSGAVLCLPGGVDFHDLGGGRTAGATILERDPVELAAKSVDLSGGRAGSLDWTTGR